MTLENFNEYDEKIYVRFNMQTIHTRYLQYYYRYWYAILRTE